jgi:hypothetical protein
MSQLVLVHPIFVTEKFADSLPRTRFGAWLQELPVSARLMRFAFPDK